MGVASLPGLLLQLTVVNRKAGDLICHIHPGVFPIDTFVSLFCYNRASSVIVALP